MEPLSNDELSGLNEAGTILESTPAWDIARKELERRREAVVSKAFLGKLETYEEYLEARAEYVALTNVIDLPGMMKDMGAQ